MFAVFKVETGVCEIAKKFRLAGKLLAEESASCRSTGADCGDDSKGDGKADVDYGRVPEEAEEGRNALGCVE